MWVSPSHQDTEFHQPLSLEDKMTIFEDRTKGWKLDIADQVINGKNQADGSIERSPIPHSGYATLDIIFSYFEMIAKYEAGFAKMGQSEKFFKQGVFLVFPALRDPQLLANIPAIHGDVALLVSNTLDVMYEGIRCGLYHSGITNGPVMLTSEIRQAIGIDQQNSRLIINPHLLVKVLQLHFVGYLADLRNPNNHIMRQNFEARFDFDSGESL